MAEGANPAEVVLPQVLEQVLALKDQRAQQLGTEDGSSEANVRENKEKDSAWEKEDNLVSFYRFFKLWRHTNISD